MLVTVGLALGAEPCGLPQVLRTPPEPLVVQGPPPPPGATETCFGPQGEHRYTTEHFSLEWDDPGIDETIASKMGEWLEEAWTRQVDELGWPQPTGSEDWLTLAWLEASEGRSYVYWELCGGRTVPYATFYTGSPGMHVTSHHEFAHLSQVGSPATWGLWWWEATATWMQVLMMPEDTESADAVVQYGFVDNPHIAMHSESRDSWEEDAHLYGMSAFAFFLEEHLGPGTVLDTWNLEGRLDMPTAIEALGLDWDAVYEEWVLAVVHNDFSRGEVWGQVGGTVLSVYADGEKTIGSLGLGVVRFHPESPAPGGSDLEIRVEVEEGDWLLWLVADDEVLPIEDGEVTLLGTADYVTIALVASPLDGLTRDFDMSWEAVGSGEPSSGGMTTAFPTDEGCEGCGAPVGPAPWLALLALIARRRSQAPRRRTPPGPRGSSPRCRRCAWGR